MTNPNWNWRPLGELFDIGAGKTMSAAARTGADKVPFLRTSNVLWDEINLTQVDEMSISPTELDDKSLMAGDLLVCEGGEIGRAAVWDGRVPVMSFQNHLHRLRPTLDDVDAHFYVYFLQSAFTQLGIFEGAGNKTTIPNLSRNRLAALDVPHPPKADQQSVAQALAKVREAIAVHDKATTTALELKHAVMNDLFMRGLRGERQKETEIGLMPESWEVAAIGTQHTVVSGGTPSRGNPAFWSGGTIPWVKTTEVDYCVITETEEHITPLGLESSAAKMLPAGTLLMAMYGQGITRGKVAILGIEAACNQACAAILPKDGTVLPRYLYHFLTWRYDAIRSLAHGGQQQNLNLEIVRELPLTFPQSQDEQCDIVTILDAVDRKIDLHRKKREVLEELFESLLHKLMTGEIAVSDLDLSALSPASTQPEEAAE
ncbi:MAG: restriction endonuclease subunit S [Betaproteobacteria bacterium]|nr:restriction endonuclease subunit S [Betaproteobacteria bacterium]